MTTFICCKCGEVNVTYLRRKWWRYLFPWTWNRNLICTPCYMLPRRDHKR